MNKGIQDRSRAQSWIVYGPVALAGLIIGGILAYWAVGSAPLDLRPTADVAPSLSASSAPAYSAPADASSDKTGTDRTGGERAALQAQQNLRMDKALGTSDDEAVADDAVTANTQAPSESAEPRLAASGSTPLNLRVPEPYAQQALEAIHTPDLRLPSDDPMANKQADASALQLSGDSSPTPQVESFSLFNPEYGLRGFMAQSWVNNSFGVQGGLGFNDGRRIETESKDIRDDIAVGMGVIMAF